VGGHFRIVTSMPNVMLLFEIQHLAALQFTQVTLTDIIQLLFIYFLNGRASLHSLHVIGTLAITDVHA